MHNEHSLNQLVITKDPADNFAIIHSSTYWTWTHCNLCTGPPLEGGLGVAEEGASAQGAARVLKY